jgi:outer membrane murein-binding lipoprotein Lpp
MHKHKLLLSVVLFMLAGCGGPKVDATNADTLKASMDKMTSDMNKEQKAEFARDFLTVAMSGAFETISKSGSKVADTTKKTDIAESMRSLHGLTVAQIREKSEAIRKKAQANASAK